jgi:carbon storage regulator CsrA
MTDVSRKVGDRLRIGDQVVITVLAIRGRQVHMKISAPDRSPFGGRRRTSRRA